MTRAVDQLLEQLADLVAERVAERIGRAPADAPVRLVTIEEYARVRSISPSTVRAAIRDGRLAVQRFGRAVRIDPTAEITRKRRSHLARANEVVPRTAAEIVPLRNHARR